MLYVTIYIITTCLLKSLKERQSTRLLITLYVYFMFIICLLYTAYMFYILRCEVYCII